jgi:hypothetical protein
MAMKALEEWSAVALDKEKPHLAKLDYLEEWETQVKVEKTGTYMDYEMFQQPKRQKSE